MNEKKDILAKATKAIAKTTVPIGPDQQTIENTIEKLAKLQGQTHKKLRTRERTKAMKKYTKFAAAAVIIIAALLSITILDKLTTPAYAIQQTIEASHSVQYLHIKSFIVSISEEPAECWVEFDLNGQVKNIRFNKPAWMSPGDGATVVVWKDDKAKLWIKKKNILATIQDKEFGIEILRMIEQLDPKNAVANILQAQDQGVIKVEIDKPNNKAAPIVITATALEKSVMPFPRVILFVNQATKLLNSIETYQLKDGQYIHFSIIEFYDYNIPIDSKMFTLEDIPSNAIIVDQTTQEIGLVQGDLTGKEISVKVVRQFYEAFIEKDYAKAGLLCSGISAAEMQKRWQNINVLRIVSISEPVPHPTPKVGGFQVHCEIEIEQDGVRSILKPYGPGVRPVHGQPHRWGIHGGVE